MDCWHWWVTNCHEWSSVAWYKVIDNCTRILTFGNNNNHPQAHPRANLSRRTTFTSFDDSESNDPTNQSFLKNNKVFLKSNQYTNTRYQFDPKALRINIANLLANNVQKKEVWINLANLKTHHKIIKTLEMYESLVWSGR